MKFYFGWLSKFIQLIMIVMNIQFMLLFNCYAVDLRFAGLLAGFEPSTATQLIF